MRRIEEFRSARAAVFIGAILTVLAAAAIFFLMHMGDQKELSAQERQALAQNVYFPTPSEKQQIGETESILNNDPDHAVSIHYPVFGIQTIDLQLLSIVEEIQKEHREQLGQERQAASNDVQSDLLVDYQSYLVGDRTASVVLTVQQRFATWDGPRARSTALVFDLVEGDLLEMEDIFQGNYLERLSEEVRSYFEASTSYSDGTDKDSFLAGTTPDAANFSNFALTTDAVQIYFEEGTLFSDRTGVPVAEIPYDRLTGVLRIRTDGPLL